MRFTQLKVGREFTLPRENNEITYKKINDNRHNNASYNGIVLSVHGCTEIKEK